jgi:hypothetical protein
MPVLTETTMEVTTGGSYRKSKATWIEMEKRLFLHRIYPLSTAFPICQCIQCAPVVFAYQAHPSLSIIDKTVVSTEYTPDLFVFERLV